MRIKIWLTALLTVPTVVLAVPTSITAATEALGTRLLRRLPAPPPCQRMNPFPSQRQTNVRFDEFVQAFAGPMSNITKAFEYIVSDYINHNPIARNGSTFAWTLLSPLWPTIAPSYIRSTIKDDMSWVNYKAGGIGEIVDRFRWEGGCIAEHWDQGEKYPTP